MCTNRWGTYKADSNHQLWSQQPNTQKSPNYCRDNYKSSSFFELFWSRQLLYKNVCAMGTGTKADFSQCAFNNKYYHERNILLILFSISFLTFNPILFYKGS